MHHLNPKSFMLCMAAVFAWTPLLAQDKTESREQTYDVVIYGGTSAAVIAAVEVKRKGKTCVIVSPDKHLGGLSSGGLGWTDTGNKAVIGGLSREFYHRVWKQYQEPSAWKWQRREDYGGKGQGTAAVDGENRTMWIFEPHIAEQVFDEFVADYDIPVFRDEWLDRDGGVDLDAGRIQRLRTLSGKTFAGQMFIDATYEGDLLATAGCDYHVGREANSEYGETYNGVQTGVLHHGHHFGVLKKKISPYKIPGDPTSGLLAKISPDPPGEFGAADKRVQAYCFRMCLTTTAENQVPFPRPENYDPADYELLLRIFDAGWNETFSKFDPLPNFKTDTNNHGPLSTDNIGMNYDYPEASYERRAEIIREHRNYQQGWLYFIANDPRVPKAQQEAMQKWGLAKDEFVDNGNWPHQLYIREARRLIGQYVMTENELLKRSETPDSVGMGSYTMDSHNVQRYITPEGYVQNEGDIGVSTNGPYKIAYGSLVPRKSQCQNLLVPVCISSSHIAFGSIRMEPVFMILGHSAATAGCMAIDLEVAVQDVPYDQLKTQLEKDGQVLEATSFHAGNGVDWTKLPGTVIDDAAAVLTGAWTYSTSSRTWVGNSYRHDGDLRDGKSSATFAANLKVDGEYEVRLAYTPNQNRTSKAKVTIKHAGGEKVIFVDQRKEPPIEGNFIKLGSFRFTTDQPAEVIVSNEGSDGYVIIDAIQWIEAEK
jgi:hypothetical protein